MDKWNIAAFESKWILSSTKDFLSKMGGANTNVVERLATTKPGQSPVANNDIVGRTGYSTLVIDVLANDGDGNGLIGLSDFATSHGNCESLISPETTG